MDVIKGSSPDLDLLFKQAMSLFQCTQCGTCCQGEGGIHLTQEEIERIAQFLSLSPSAFQEKFCLAKNGKVYIHIREDRYCHFAQDGKCTIHSVKPAPCRRWPFLKPMFTDQANWETARLSCQALAPFKSLEEYLNQ